LPLPQALKCHRSTPEPARRTGALVFSHLEAEIAQNPTYGQFHTDDRFLKRIARSQNRPRLLGGDRLAMHLAVPAELEQASDPLGVLAVCLNGNLIVMGTCVSASLVFQLF